MRRCEQLENQIDAFVQLNTVKFAEWVQRLVHFKNFKWPCFFFDFEFSFRKHSAENVVFTKINPYFPS